MDNIIPSKIFSYCLMDFKSLRSNHINEIHQVYEKHGKDQFFEQAKNKKILPYVAHVLSHLDCDKTFWIDIHNKYKNRNNKILKLLDEVFISLSKEGLTNICLAENFASVLMSDSCIGCFSSGDVDLYCYDIDLEKLDKIMESKGFSWNHRHKRKKSFAKEYKSIDVIGEEFWFNFQWKPMTRKKTHLYDQRYILKRYIKFFQNTEYYKNTNIRYFSPTIALYLNIVHIASGHYYILSPGIRLYADIDRPARYCSINWKKLKTWLIEDHLGIRPDVVLGLAQLQLETPISRDFLVNKKKKKIIDRFMNSLIDKNSFELKIPKKGRLKYLMFLTRVELLSDGINLLSALIKRFWVILTDWK